MIAEDLFHRGRGADLHIIGGDALRDDRRGARVGGGQQPGRGFE
jgi:hypothetical protein